MRVLVSGASLAGPTLAYWLTRRGHDVTIVERAARPREGGSPIDVRGAAVDVADRMGLLPAISAARVRTEAIEYVDGRGRRKASIHPEAYAEPGGRDIEVERGALVNLLYDATKNDTEYRFEESIATLAQDAGGVDVTFVRGGPERFDLVVGADGTHSIVRRLVFGEESRFLRHLGLYVSIVSVDPALGTENRGVMYNSPGRLAGVYRYRGKADAVFMFRSPELSYDHHDLHQQKKLLSDVYSGEGWQVPALLDAVAAADDLYFDAVNQVHMSTWSRGRVTLVGDAGYCASPLSGMGTTLAMVGAAALAEALESGEDALARYEQAHRPLVTKAQASVSRGAGMLVPATSGAIWRRDQFTKLLPMLLAGRRLVGR
ncbi:FAD-dependent monooxygenase [Actinophytocola sp.]|uniref:FAD-dependent monooxygenase n=1 Tax=Actinophytocola sp. TaxID=1872138 RepID=UPI002ED41945